MKQKLYIILNLVAILLILLFFIMLVIDVIKYNPVTTSAPFYVNIIIRGLEFLLPSLILFIMGIFLKKNN